MRVLIFMRLSLFEEHKKGYLLSYFTVDVENVHAFLFQFITGMLRNVIAFAALIGFMIYQSVEWTLIVFFILIYSSLL